MACPGIRTTPPLSLSGPSCTVTSRLSTPVRSGASGPKGGLERGMEALLSNFRSRAEPVGKGHSTRAAGVRRRKKPWANDKSRDVFGLSASVEGFPANGRMDCCIQAKRVSRIASSGNAPQRLCADVHCVHGYSARSACMGSSRAARKAGKRKAALATETSAATEASNTHGSCVEVP